MFRVDQLSCENLSFDVSRFRNSEVLEVRHEAFLAYLNNFKGSKEAGDLNAVADAGKSFVPIHVQMMLPVDSLHHPPKASITTRQCVIPPGADLHLSPQFK